MSVERPRSERRLNQLTGDWVLVSPHRLQRPWQGAVSAAAQPPAASFDPNCYLCPGAARAGGLRNPDYDGVFVFANDFPALLEGRGHDAPFDPLLVREPEAGQCRVICYSPDHGRTMATMTQDQIAAIVDAWAGEFCALSAQDDIAAVTIFENRGEMMGASCPHPHGQIWATQSVPNELAREDATQRRWQDQHGTPLLVAYGERERAEGTRLVAVNDSFVALVPYWAAWPFETLVLPRRAVAGMDGLLPAERADLAQILGRLTAGYDRLFETPFPYSMGFHQRPHAGGAHGHFVLHAHFYPPLLRSATVRKFMVGFEMLAMPQRDLTPEAAAERLRAVIPT